MSTAISFTLTLTMTSEWHIGSGVGRQGAVDSLVIRDADDLPCAPSSTVAGMWRDAAEQLAFGLDEAAGPGSNGWSEVVTSLFGSQPAIGEYAGQAPAPSRLALEHLRLDATLREALSGPARASLREALTFVKPGIRIDPRRESAMTDMLRFEEVCRRGGVLTGQATIDTTCLGKEDADLVAAFAFASLRLLERIGGSRRRGLGRCDANVCGVEGTCIRDVDGALKHLHDQSDSRPHGVAPKAGTMLPSTGNEIAFGAARQDLEFIEIPLVIEALSPLLVMDQRLGNVTTCLDHVPGTMLLPIVTRALRDAGVCAKQVTRWITSGALSVAPAYATIGDARGLPMPLRWQWAKREAAASRKCVSNAPISETGADLGGGPDAAGAGSHTDAGVERTGAKADSTQRVHPKGGELIALCSAVEEGTYLTRRVSHVVQTHNTVEDNVQKPTEEVGGLYTYEAIRSGETLASVIRLPEDGVPSNKNGDVLAKFLKKMDRDARIGAVGRRGYGSVRLKADQCQQAAAHNDLEECTSAVLWLTSDLCLPAPIGTRSCDVPAEAPGIRHQLAAALGRTIGREVEITRSWMRTRRHESWQRQWGLPRPSLTLVRAGSVVVIETRDGNGAFTEDELGGLERYGAGERRAEGHGRIRVNAHEVTRHGEFRVAAPHATAKKSDRTEESAALADSTAGSSTPKLESSTKDFARAVETAAWRTYLLRRAEEATATPDKRKSVLGWTRNEPSASQLGKMRGLLNGARTEKDVKAVCKWLKTKPDGWHAERGENGAATKLENVLDDPFAVLSAVPRDVERSGEAGPNTSPEPGDTWLDAPPPLTRSLCEIRKDSDLKRYAIAAIVHAALRAHRRAAETPPETGNPDPEVEGPNERQETL